MPVPACREFYMQVYENVPFSSECVPAGFAHAGISKWLAGHAELPPIAIAFCPGLHPDNAFPTAYDTGEPGGRLLLVTQAAEQNTSMVLSVPSLHV
jgi:hypothetical protein